jgi:O-antigen/teichoic acid export membrane protein
MARSREQWSFVLQHQILAISLLYLVLLPVQMLFFWLEFLPGSVALWFFALLVVEHLSQELSRLLVAMQRPIAASLVLFVRLGLWIWLAVPLMWMFPEWQQLDTVFLLWFVGGFIAVSLGAVMVWRTVPNWRWWRIDWGWLRAGYRKGFMFLAATMCFRALFTADRFVMEHFAGAEMLGVYVLYSGMAMAIVTFLDPMVFSFLYPRLVSAWQKGNYDIYRRILKELSMSAVLASLALAGVCAILAPWVLHWTGKAIYLAQLPLLWGLLILAVVHGIGMVPHYALYARGADRAIVFSHVSSLAVFAVIIALTADKWPLYAVPVGLIGAFLWMGGAKLWIYCRMAPYS